MTGDDAQPPGALGDSADTTGGSRITLVAAVARNGVIGNGPDIPWSLPGEQRRFKELTLGHVLVMGRKTYDSIGRPLPGRTTIVVTRQPGWQPADGASVLIRVAADLETALAMGAAIDDEVYVVGGGEIYAAAMPCADRLVITHVDREPAGDAFFPAIDASEWVAGTPDHHGEWSIIHYERYGRPAKKVSPGM